MFRFAQHDRYLIIKYLSGFLAALEIYRGTHAICMAGAKVEWGNFERSEKSG